MKLAVVLALVFSTFDYVPAQEGRHTGAPRARVSKTIEAAPKAPVRGAPQRGCPGNTSRIHGNVNPCRHVATGNSAVDQKRSIYWPADKVISSNRFPILLHYRHEAEREEAQRQLGFVERSWEIQVEKMGWRRPLPDVDARGNVLCGPDDRFDVFVWCGHSATEVSTLEVEGRKDSALPGYMVLDPWGKYGMRAPGEKKGTFVDISCATVAHEFNHACQASYDWYDLPIIYEMTANFMQREVVLEDRDYFTHFTDFQSQPQWSLDRDDGYDTWYMYGSSLYFTYLRDRFFGGRTDGSSAGFAREVWERLANGPGSDPTKNHPHFEEALDAILARNQAPLPATFFDSVAEFARWRWYTGTRDDGRHFGNGKIFAIVKPQRTVSVGRKPVRVNLTPAPMLLGSAYVEVTRPAGETGIVSIALDLPAASQRVRWVVQAVPGLSEESDGETLDLSKGTAMFRLAGGGKRALVVTALPLALKRSSGKSTDPIAAYEPNQKHDTQYPATLVLSAK